MACRCTSCGSAADLPHDAVPAVSPWGHSLESRGAGTAAPSPSPGPRGHGRGHTRDPSLPRRARSARRAGRIERGHEANTRQTSERRPAATCGHACSVGQYMLVASNPTTASSARSAARRSRHTTCSASSSSAASCAALPTSMPSYDIASPCPVGRPRRACESASGRDGRPAPGRTRADRHTTPCGVARATADAGRRPPGIATPDAYLGAP